MKKFLKFVAAWKTGASLMFSAAVAIYLVFCWFFGEARVPVGVLWGLLLACLAGSLLQGVCFSRWVIRRMRYSLRLALFAAVYLPLLSAIAWWCRWFPAGRLGAWLVFAGVFLVFLAVFTVGFEIYYRATGKRYDGLLGQYRRQQEDS